MKNSMTYPVVRSIAVAVVLKLRREGQSAYRSVYEIETYSQVMERNDLTHKIFFNFACRQPGLLKEGRPGSFQIE